MANLENTTTTETTNEQGQEAKAPETEEKLQFTKDELDALIQKEGDRRVTQALKSQEKKNADKLKEAEKLAKMSAEEKYIYELEQREKLIEQREAQLALSENKNVCSKILADKGLSLAFVDFVVDTDADVMQERIKTIDKAFKASVRQEVERRLTQKSPSTSSSTNASMTKEQFAKITDGKVLMEMKKNDPDLWDALTK